MKILLGLSGRDYVTDSLPPEEEKRLLAIVADYTRNRGWTLEVDTSRKRIRVIKTQSVDERINRS